MKRFRRESLSLSKSLTLSFTILTLFTLCFTNISAFAQEQQERESAQTTQIEKDDANAPSRIDFSRLVVVGDSLSAGYQNNSLLETQQPNGYASLIAGRANTQLTLPLIAAPGIPNVLRLVSPGPPPVIVPVPGISTGRTNPLVQAHNLAVPGAKVRDALLTRPNFPIDSLTDFVLGFPGLLTGVSRSQVEWAENLQPTAILLWIGNNDALGAALGANPALLTPQAEFETSFRQVIDRLAATNAKIAVANIPDVTVVPYLITAEEVALLVNLPLTTISQPLGIRAGDYVTPDALPLIPGILANPTTGPLPANVVLTAAEVTTIRTAVTNYNRFIASEARRKGAALVDINRTLSVINRFAYPVILSNPVEFRLLTTDFLNGLFSLDGVHPTNTGYAIVANEFITALNLRFGARLSYINVWRVASEDPLVLRAPGYGVENRNSKPFGDSPLAPSAGRDIPIESVESMRSLFAPEK